MTDASRPAARLASMAKRFGPLLVLIAVLVVVFASGAWRHLSLDELRRHNDVLRGFVAEHPVGAVLAYLAVYTVAVCCPPPAVLIMTLTGGFLFGWLEGGAAATLGVTLGACVLFVACRTAVGSALRDRTGSIIARIERGLNASPFFNVVALRLIPGAPFTIVSLALGFLEVPFRAYALGTLVGIAPASFVMASIGAGLGALFSRHEPVNIHTIQAMAMEPRYVLPLVGLALLSLLPMLVRRLRKKA